MDKTFFPVRHSITGEPADDLVVGIEETQLQAVDTRLGYAGNATTLANQAQSGIALRTATQIADKTDSINTTGKFKGRLVYDTTDDLIYFALGATSTSKWRLTGSVDATGDVTPS